MIRSRESGDRPDKKLKSVLRLVEDTWNQYWNIREIFAGLVDRLEWSEYVNMPKLKELVDKLSVNYLFYDDDYYLEGSGRETAKDLVIHLLCESIYSGDMIVEGAEPEDDPDDYGIEGFELPKPSVTEDKIITTEMIIGMIMMSEFLLVSVKESMQKTSKE